METQIAVDGGDIRTSEGTTIFTVGDDNNRNTDVVSMKHDYGTSERYTPSRHAKKMSHALVRPLLASILFGKGPGAEAVRAQGDQIEARGQGGKVC